MKKENKEMANKPADIRMILADQYIESLKEIISKFNVWKSELAEKGVRLETKEDVEDAFMLRFGKIREMFNKHVELCFSTTETEVLDRKRSFVSSFDAMLEEWHSFRYAKVMPDCEPLGEREIALLEIGENNDLILSAESEKGVRDSFEKMILTENGIRLAEIQENLRKNIQDLYDMFENVQGTDRPFFLQLTPASMMRLFRVDDRTEKVKVMSVGLKYDDYLLNS